MVKMCIRDSGSTVQCDFMNQVFSSHGFVKGKNYTAASLGLKNGGAMNFILPDKGVKADDLLLTADKVSDLLSGGEPKSGMVTFKLPKFNFNTDIEMCIRDRGRAWRVQSDLLLTAQIVRLHNTCLLYTSRCV